MGPRVFSRKIIYIAYFSCYHFAISRGGYMKTTNILCKSLCIYGSQVPARVCGGWGSVLGWDSGALTGVGARIRMQGAVATNIIDWLRIRTHAHVRGALLARLS